MNKPDRQDNDVKRRVGRPTKPDALTPAERAKRYREKRKSLKASAPLREVTRDTVAQLTARLVELQMKYDLERTKVIGLETRLLTDEATRSRPKPPDPLSRELKALRERVAEQDRIISACNAEINRMRDDLAASR
jgi:uncharacterized coiled-coil protein SlyX